MHRTSIVHFTAVLCFSNLATFRPQKNTIKKKKNHQYDTEKCKKNKKQKHYVFAALHVAIETIIHRKIHKTANLIHLNGQYLYGYRSLKHRTPAYLDLVHGNPVTVLNATNVNYCKADVNVMAVGIGSFHP